MVEHLSAVVTLETLLRRELVHPFDVTAVGAHVTKRFVAVRALDTFSAFLKRKFIFYKLVLTLAMTTSSTYTGLVNCSDEMQDYTHFKF